MARRARRSAESTRMDRVHAFYMRKMRESCDLTYDQSYDFMTYHLIYFLLLFQCKNGHVLFLVTNRCSPVLVSWDVIWLSVAVVPYRSHEVVAPTLSNFIVKLS